MKNWQAKMLVRKKGEKTKTVFTFRCVLCKHEKDVEDDGDLFELPPCEKCGGPTYAKKVTLTKLRL